MSNQDFTGLQLVFICIMDQSTDGLVCKNSENSEKCRHNYSEPKVTPSQRLFFPTNSPNLKIIKNKLKFKNN